MGFAVIRPGTCDTCGWVRDATLTAGTLYTDIWHREVHKRGKIAPAPEPCAQCQAWDAVTPVATELPEVR